MTTDDDADPMIVTCQGAPLCDLQSDTLEPRALEARMNACVWCIRETVHADGSSTTTQPSRC